MDKNVSLLYKCMSRDHMEVPMLRICAFVVMHGKVDTLGSNTLHVSDGVEALSPRSWSWINVIFE